MAIGGVYTNSNFYQNNYNTGSLYGKESSQIGNEEKVDKVTECETCKNRRYQDGSNEGDVSFKAPGHISPSSSYGKVMSHEKEHVANAYEKANKNNGEVVNVSVHLTTARCPECGRTYVAEGETVTQIKYQKENPYSQNAKAYDEGVLAGSNVNEFV